MIKDVDIVIYQKPISVAFSCPHCGNDIEIDYKVFEDITRNNLYNLIDNSIEFDCPNCRGKLVTDGVELDWL